jgi:peptidoglycan/xylan/chitin deacetylase (PgdA/CDA1 family)/N-acetylmuramoyl-L-alanine amidase
VGLRGWAAVGLTVAGLVGACVWPALGAPPTESPVPTPQVAAPTPVPPTPPTREGRLAGRRICLDPGHDAIYNPGASARDRTGRVIFDEHDLTFEVAVRLRALLQAEGAEVCLTRNDQGLLQLEPGDFNGNGTVTRPEDLVERVQPRVDFINAFGAEIMVSVHFNGSTNPALKGTEVYFSDVPEQGPENRRLAQALLDALVDALGRAHYPAVNRGIKSDRYKTEYLDYAPYYGFDRSCADCARLLTLGNNPMLAGKGQWRAGALAEVLFLSNPDDVGFLRRPDALDVIAAGLFEGILSYYGAEARRPPAPAATPQSTPGLLTFTGPVEIGRGDPARPEIALTFDCGAGAGPTPAILDALAAAGVRATFFVTGQWARANPDLLRAIAAEHEIANHSWSHRDFTKLSDAEIVRELEATEEVIVSLTGRTTKPFWRAPFGARNSRVLAVAAAAGWPVHVFWTVERTPAGWVSGDSGDWRPITADQVVANVLRAAGLGGGVITVNHCGSELTPPALPEILGGLGRLGLRPVTLSELPRG